MHRNRTLVPYSNTQSRKQMIRAYVTKIKHCLSVTMMSSYAWNIQINTYLSMVYFCFKYIYILFCILFCLPWCSFQDKLLKCILYILISFSSGWQLMLSVSYSYTTSQWMPIPAPWNFQAVSNMLRNIPFFTHCEKLTINLYYLYLHTRSQWELSF